VAIRRQSNGPLFGATGDSRAGDAFVFGAPFAVGRSSRFFPRLVGQIDTARQVLSDTTTFRDCTFQHCRSSSAGGVLSITSGSVGVSISTSHWIKCSCVGSISSYPCLSFSVSHPSALACSSTEISAHDSHGASSATGAMDFRDSSITDSTGKYTTWFMCRAHANGSTTHIECVSVSQNQLSMHASGIDLEELFNLSFHFCIFAGNSRRNCLLLNSNNLNSNISCIALFGNLCPSTTETVGLISVRTTQMRILNCVFQRNTCDDFVGTPSRYSGVCSTCRRSRQRDLCRGRQRSTHTKRR
jgi:hypothetical protein